MNLVNGISTTIFDIVLTPLEMINFEVAIAVVSAIFGILGLVIFKYISSQKGIKAAKDRIKGHMIEIRIYQDDLKVVGVAVCKVLFQNAKYLSLNLMPFIPLSVPFVLLLSQLVVRYAFEPMPEGQAFTMTVELDRDQAQRVADLEVIVPDWVEAEDLIVVRAPSEGRAFVSVRSAEAGQWEFGFKIGDSLVTKSVIIGAQTETPRSMQPERVGGFWDAWLWPAEATIESDSPIQRVAIEGGYPASSFAFLPDGILGLLLGVILYSFIAGLAILKPLGVTI